MEQLITDRVHADTVYASQNQHIPNLKGAYGANDLNRVGEWTNNLADRISAIGYAITSPNLKTTWTISDKPNATDFSTYLSGVQSVRSTFMVLATTPALPGNINELNEFQGWIKANNIEKNLYDMDLLVSGMENTIDLGWTMGLAHTGLFGGI